MCTLQMKRQNLPSEGRSGCRMDFGKIQAPTALVLSHKIRPLRTWSQAFCPSFPKPNKSGIPASFFFFFIRG